jgi:hypothetical protein
MSIVKFISTEYLKQNTALQENVDDTLVTPYIIKAQDTHIQSILGTNYYNHLKDAVKTNTLTTRETTLLREFIQPAVSEWTFYEVIPHLNYKATNKAVSTQNSEYSNPSSLDEIKYLRNSVRDMAEFYTKRLERELSLNQQYYPLWANQNLNNLPINRKTYFSGVYLKGRGSNNYFLDKDDECC